MLGWFSLIIGVFVLVGLVVVHGKWFFPKRKADPRWKNREKAIDFLFGSLTIGGTVLIAIAGYVN